MSSLKNYSVMISMVDLVESVEIMLLVKARIKALLLKNNISSMLKFLSSIILFRILNP